MSAQHPLGGDRNATQAPAASEPSPGTSQADAIVPNAARPEYTADELLDAITASIQAHDFTATFSLLRMLAVKDPRRAQAVYDTILTSLEIAAQAREGQP